jgi:hypothetical protein
MPTLKRSRLSPFHQGRDICDDIAAEGWVPEQARFRNGGATGPPYHPNCRCRLEFREEREPSIEDIPPF